MTLKEKRKIRQIVDRDIHEFLRENMARNISASQLCPELSFVSFKVTDSNVIFTFKNDTHTVDAISDDITPDCNYFGTVRIKEYKKRVRKK